MTQKVEQLRASHYEDHPDYGMRLEDEERYYEKCENCFDAFDFEDEEIEYYEEYDLKLCLACYQRMVEEEEE